MQIGKLYKMETRFITGPFVFQLKPVGEIQLIHPFDILMFLGTSTKYINAPEVPPQYGSKRCKDFDFVWMEFLCPGGIVAGRWMRKTMIRNEPGWAPLWLRPL